VPEKHERKQRETTDFRPHVIRELRKMWEVYGPEPMTINGMCAAAALGPEHYGTVARIVREHEAAGHLKCVNDKITITHKTGETTTHTRTRNRVYSYQPKQEESGRITSFKTEVAVPVLPKAPDSGLMTAHILRSVDTRLLTHRGRDYWETDIKRDVLDRIGTSEVVWTLREWVASFDTAMRNVVEFGILVRGQGAGVFLIRPRLLRAELEAAHGQFDTLARTIQTENRQDHESIRASGRRSKEPYNLLKSAQ
jgi:hypothetical protein